MSCHYQTSINNIFDEESVRYSILFFTFLSDQTFSHKHTLTIDRFSVNYGTCVI